VWANDRRRARLHPRIPILAWRRQLPCAVRPAGNGLSACSTLSSQASCSHCYRAESLWPDSCRTIARPVRPLLRDLRRRRGRQDDLREGPAPIRPTFYIEDLIQAARAQAPLRDPNATRESSSSPPPARAERHAPHTGRGARRPTRTWNLTREFSQAGVPRRNGEGATVRSYQD